MQSEPKALAQKAKREWKKRAVQFPKSYVLLLKKCFWPVETHSLVEILLRKKETLLTKTKSKQKKTGKKLFCHWDATTPTTSCCGLCLPEQRTHSCIPFSTLLIKTPFRRNIKCFLTDCFILYWRGDEIQQSEYQRRQQEPPWHHQQAAQRPTAASWAHTGSRQSHGINQHLVQLHYGFTYTWCASDIFLFGVYQGLWIFFCTDFLFHLKKKINKTHSSKSSI